MGRIHRYGQEKDCLIFNFVSTNTREGRVLHKLFERIQAIEDDLDPKRTGKVFNVLGDVFPANQLEKMIRDMYAHNQMDEELIKQRIVEQVDTKRLESITNSTLEGLAKRELNLSAIIGKSAEAKERRLVPEVIEDFFTQAAPIVGVHPNEIREGGHVYKLGKVPRTLWPVGERLEPRFGKLGREYKNIVFDKEYLKTRTDLGMGYARPSAVRGCAGRRDRACPRRLAARCGILRSSSQPALPARCFRRVHQRRTQQPTSPPSVCCAGRLTAAQ